MEEELRIENERLKRIVTSRDRRVEELTNYINYLKRVINESIRISSRRG